MPILILARAGMTVAALFGGALVLKEAKQTVQVVPDTVRSLKSLIVPVTIIAAVFLVRALKGK